MPSLPPELGSHAAAVANREGPIRGVAASCARVTYAAAMCALARPRPLAAGLGRTCARGPTCGQDRNRVPGRRCAQVRCGPVPRRPDRRASMVRGPARVCLELLARVGLAWVVPVAPVPVAPAVRASVVPA